MNRIVPAVVLVFALFLAACGVDRASDVALATDAVPATNGTSDNSGDNGQADESDSDGGDGAPGGSSIPTTLAPLPPPTTGVPTEVALSADFGDGGTWQITHGELNEVVAATQENQEFVNLVFRGAVPPEFATGVLTEHLVLQALRVELAAAGGTVGDEDVAFATQDLLTQVEQQLYAGAPDAAAMAQALYDQAPYLPFLSGYQATQDALSTALSAQAAADGSAPEVPCVRHILVDAEADAAVIMARLSAGDDFSELAIELSTGPSGPSGGALGCASSSGYVPEFRDAVDAAEVGEFVGPVQTDFGWHVIVVDGYEPGPAVDGRTLSSQLLQERLSAATVEVDPALGTWDPAGLLIIPAAQ